MKIRVSHLSELVASAALGFATARMYSDLWLGSPDYRLAHWISLVFMGMMPGIAVAQALGLAIEVRQGHAPPAWGIGRWSWGLSGFYVLLESTLAYAPVWLIRRFFGQKNHLNFMEGGTNRWLDVNFLGTVPWMIAAFFVISCLARLPRDPKPDFREWSGRVYLATLFLAWFYVDANDGFNIWENPPGFR